MQHRPGCMRRRRRDVCRRLRRRGRPRWECGRRRAAHDAWRRRHRRGDRTAWKRRRGERREDDHGSSQALAASRMRTSARRGGMRGSHWTGGSARSPSTAARGPPITLGAPVTSASRRQLDRCSMSGRSSVLAFRPGRRGLRLARPRVACSSARIVGAVLVGVVATGSAWPCPVMVNRGPLGPRSSVRAMARRRESARL